MTDGELQGLGLRGRQRIGRVDDASPDTFTTRSTIKECVLFIISIRFCIVLGCIIYSIFSDFFFNYFFANSSCSRGNYRVPSPNPTSRGGFVQS